MIYKKSRVKKQFVRFLGKPESSGWVIDYRVGNYKRVIICQEYKEKAILHFYSHKEAKKLLRLIMWAIK